MTQMELIEPTGERVIELAHMHARQAKKAQAQAQVAAVYGWDAVQAHWLQVAQAEQTMADDMATLAQLEALSEARQ